MADAALLEVRDLRVEFSTRRGRAMVLNGVDFASIKTDLGLDTTGKMVSIGWGLFINALIVFIVVMLVVYLIAKIFIKEEEAAGPSAEEVLLTEIRDELRKRPT